MFKGFDKRLKRDVQRLVDGRLRESEELSKHKVRIYPNLTKSFMNLFFSQNQLM
jgi:hypothetical protein